MPALPEGMSTAPPTALAASVFADGLAAARFLQQVKAWLERVNDETSLY